jgi:uncharacterized protein YjiK
LLFCCSGLLQSRRNRPLVGVLIVFVLVLFVVVCAYFGWAMPYVFKVGSSLFGRSDSALALDRYQVAIDALPIAGVEENASGLTYHSGRNTLFSVINRPPQVIELSLDGVLLHSWPVDGVTDLEGITHIQGDEFFLVDERLQQLIHVRVRFDEGQNPIVTHDRPRLTVAAEVPGNLGFEGVSWDDRNNRLFVVKEKDPLRLLEFRGFAEIVHGGRVDLDIREWRLGAPLAYFLRDLSSVSYHEGSGMLLLLSDESRLVLELGDDHKPLSMLVLRRGWHGLKRDIPQAEGVAVGAGNSIFVISEPNLFYRFDRN